MIPDTLLQKAWEKIEGLQVGQTIDKETTKNWDVFVDCAKLYISSEKKGEFNNDYSKFKQTLRFKEIENQFK